MKHKNLLSMKDFDTLHKAKKVTNRTGTGIDVLNEKLNKKQQILFDQRLDFFDKNPKSELVLGIEGKFTNIRIWLSNGYVYMRLDRANNYSVPLSVNTVGYLEKDHPVILQLAKEFGFESEADNLEKIIELTIKMKQRDIVEW